MKNLQLRTKLITGITLVFLIIIICLVIIKYYSVININNAQQESINNGNIISSLLNRQLLFSLIVIVCGYFFAILIIISATNPLLRKLRIISGALDKFKTDEYNIKIPVDGKDELTRLVAGINSICGKIKDAYEELRESRKKYEKLVDNLEEEYIFFSKSQSGNLLTVSSSVKTILGYEEDEFIKLKESLYTNNPVNEQAREHEQKSLEGIQQPKYIVELVSKKGEPHTLEISEIPLYDEKKRIISIEGIAQDITKEKRAEDLIKEQEEKYKLLFDKASDFVFLYEIDDNYKPGKFLEVNDYTTQELGYSQEELKKMSPDDLAAVEYEDDQSIENKPGEGSKFERIWESKDGTLLNVEISNHNFRIKGRNVAIAIARDITERKRVEEEIRYVNEELINQKENLEALIDNLTQTQEQLVQSEKMAALGQLIAGVAHEINTPLGAIKASIGNLNDSLDKAINELPALITKHSAEELKLFIKILDLADHGSPNITSREKRKYRKEISKVLTDNNIGSANIIADIFIYLHIFEKYNEIIDLFKSEKSLEILNSAKNFASIQKNTHTILLAVEKATKVVFALKKYVHKDVAGEKVPTDIVDGIETVLTLYQNQLKQGVEVIRNYEELPQVSCYEDEMNQVWTNLIHNAIHAMNYSGILKISTKNNIDSVCISFSDNGSGIEKDIQDKIFEPFFTTKKQGEGSGMGLDIVKKIIEKHDGIITFKSELGKGTEFIINLPVK